MKSSSNSTVVPVKTPTERFINTVTNFHNSYGVSSQGRQKHSSIMYTNSANNSKLPDQDRSSSAPILANFLKIYHEFSYLLLFCPFTFRTDERGRFFIKKSRPQMVLCAAMNLLCFIRLTTEIRASLEKEYKCQNASKNPVQYFSIIMAVASFFYKMVTMQRFWFHQQDYLNVLTLIQKNPLLREKPSSIKFFQTVFFLRIFFAMASAHAFAAFILGKNFISQSQFWSTSLWSTQLVKFARYTFCFEKNFNIDDVTPPTTTTAVDIFLTVLMSIILIQRNILAIFADLFLLSHTITLWMTAKSFSTSVLTDIQRITKRERNEWDDDNLEEQHTVAYDDRRGDHSEERDLRWSDVYRRFRVVQKLAMTINTALGSLVTWYMAEAVMYYSINLNTILTSKDVFARVDLAVFYCATFGVLFMSADICSQMENVKVWISFGENRKTLPADEFNMVLHEMLAKDVGIRGSNVFTVTYPLLAVFFSTTVTYFIICVQQGDNSVSILQDTNSTVASKC